MYKFEMPKGDWESPPVYFALSDPVPLKNRNNSLMGDEPGLPSGEESRNELSAEEMTAVSDCTERTAAERVNRILAGEASPRPLKDGQESPCALCDHPDACPFDDSLPGCRIPEVNHRRRIDLARN